MENRFKLRISRMFRSSFGSCCPKNISGNVIQPPGSAPQTENHQRHDYQLVELLSRKPAQTHPSSIFCMPKCPKSPDQLIPKDFYSRRKITDRQSLLASTGTGLGNQKFPHSIFTQNKFCEPRALRKKTKYRCSYRGILPSSDEDCYEAEDEEDDKTTLFSSKGTLSTDSSFASNSFGQSKAGDHSLINYRTSLKTRMVKRAAAVRKDLAYVLQGKMKGSFPVVKSSRDPYGDFRTSMVEMIVDKQIFTAKDLENLLQCFLFLNSYNHHKIIIEAFVDIWEALFS